MEIEQDSGKINYEQMDRSRSRSQDKDDSDHSEENEDMNDENVLKAHEREKRRLKKKKRRKVKRPYHELLSDPQVLNNIRNNINLDDKIPEHMKSRFKKIELNHLAVCLTGLPYTITKQELKHYFNTFLNARDSKKMDENAEPVKRVDVGEHGKYGVLYLTEQKTADFLVEDVETLEYMSYKIKVTRLTNLD